MSAAPPAGPTVRLEVGERLLTALELLLPVGWVQVTDGNEPDEMVFIDGPLSLRVLLRRTPRAGVDIELANSGTEPCRIESPVLVLDAPGAQLPWLAGATGRVLLPGGDGGGVWRQWRGNCSPPEAGSAPGGIALFGRGAWVPPGRALGAGWRLEYSTSGSLPEDPAWLPDSCFMAEGEEISLRAPDAALTAPGLTIHEVGDDTLLQGPVGIHHLTLSDARGATEFDVGWHPGLGELAGAAAGLTPDAGLAAWLRVGSDGSDLRSDPSRLDHLDRLLGRALETPDMWGVLAGLRAAMLTDLPVWAEAHAAARVLIASQPGTELAPILLALGHPQSPPGPVPGAPGADWWDVLSRDDERLRLQVLDRIDHGRITSRPPAHGGRGVALASLWLATREHGHDLPMVARAVDRTTSRLLAGNVAEPDGGQLAWLLLAETLRVER